MVLTIIILCNLKPIPDTIYGMKIPRMPWIFLQLLPQAANQTVSIAVHFFPYIRFSIDHATDLRIGINTSRMPGHDCKDIKFPGSQQHFFFLHYNLTLEHIQKKSLISDLLWLHVDFHTLQSLEFSLEATDLRQSLLWKFNHHLSLQSVPAPFSSSIYSLNYTIFIKIHPTNVSLLKCLFDLVQFMPVFHPIFYIAAVTANIADHWNFPK